MNKKYILAILLFILVSCQTNNEMVEEWYQLREGKRIYTYGMFGRQIGIGYHFYKGQRERFRALKFDEMRIYMNTSTNELIIKDIRKIYNATIPK